MATLIEQLQERLDEVIVDLAEEKELKRNIGRYKQTGDGQDRVTNQNLDPVLKRIATLEAERTSLQNQINRLNGVGRVQTRPVSTIRIR